MRASCLTCDPGSRALQPPEPRALPGAGGPDAAADPEQWGRPVGAGEHDQAQVRRREACRPGPGLPRPEETAQVLLHLLHVRRGVEIPSA